MPTLNLVKCQPDKEDPLQTPEAIRSMAASLRRAAAEVRNGEVVAVVGGYLTHDGAKHPLLAATSSADEDDVAGAAVVATAELLHDALPPRRTP